MTSPRRWALVTGASMGIGRAMARAYAARGIGVVCAARTEPLIAELASEIRAAGGVARPLALDVSRCDEAVARIRAADEAVGGIDVVVANAGVGEAKGAGPSFAWEAVRDAFHTNVCGAVATLTALFPRMLERDRGQLVGIGSLAAYGALPGALAYSAPKAALAMALDCLALDAAGTGVAVTHVELGFVRTRMVAEATHPMPQLLEVDDAGERIVRAVERRPRRVVLPRGLAALTRALALLPDPVRREIARRTR